jgi:hypothetical protein
VIEQHRAQRIALRNVKVQRQPAMISRQAYRRPVDNTYPRGAIAVLGDKQHGHQDPVGLRQVQGVPIRLAMLSITLIRAALRSAAISATDSF